MRKITFLLLAVSIAFCVSSPVFAAVPRLINYQGKITDANGQPLDGSYSITFRLYNAASAGTMRWEEVQTGVSIQKGYFNVLLGSVTNLNLAFDEPYFLEIKVGTEVMSPRQQITSSGYAIRAEKAESADTVATADKALKIEARTTDPASPENGRVWLRSDL